MNFLLIIRASPLPPSSSQPLRPVFWNKIHLQATLGFFLTLCFGQLKTGAIFFCSVYQIREETVLGYDEEVEIITLSHDRIYIYSTCKYLVWWYFVFINTVYT